MNVLIVDDSPVLLATTSKIISHLGYSIFTAVNGQKAVAVFKETKIDLILMDAEMPVKSGAEATIAIYNGERKLKADNLIQMSDEALYKAKGEGRNRIIIYSQAS